MILSRILNITMTKSKLYCSLYKRVIDTMKIMKNKYKVIKFGEILKILQMVSKISKPD